MTRSPRNLLLILLFVLTALSASSCRSMQPHEFADNTPAFDPLTFFDGRTHSWAVIENRRGNPTGQFTAELIGRRDGDTLFLEQNFTFDDGRKQQRLWRIRRIDASHFEATANDVVGLSKGETAGNAFRWSYVTEGSYASSIDDLRYSLWMYLMEDGETLINSVTVTKFGVVVARATEYFRRD